MLLHTLGFWSDPERRRRILKKVDEILLASGALTDVAELWFHTPKTKLGIGLATIGTVGILRRSMDDYMTERDWNDIFHVQKIQDQKYQSETLRTIIQDVLVTLPEAEIIPMKDWSDGTVLWKLSTTTPIYFVRWQGGGSHFHTKSGDATELEEILRTLLWNVFENQILLSVSQEDELISFAISDKAYFGPNDEISLSKRLDLYGKIGQTSRALLLVGPPGTGKSTIAQRLALHRGGRIFKISPVSEDADLDINLITGLIELLQPSATILDDLDKLRSSYSLLQIVEAIRVIPNSLLIATINDLNQINEGLRRPERFDDIILYDALGEPYHTEHVKYLCEQHQTSINLEEAVESTRGLPPVYVKEAILFSIATGLPTREKVDHMKMIMGITND